MNIFINIKNKIILFSFVSYLFLWGLGINDKFFLRYLILLPFLFSIFEKNIFLKINIKRFFLIPIFLLFHYFIVNYFNHTPYNTRDLIGILFLCIIIFTFVIYRDFFLLNLVNILKIFFLLLIFSSFIYDRPKDIGSCSDSFFSYFPFLENIQISKGFFIENAHLAMLNIGAIISSIYICTKKKDILLLALAVLSFVINIFNLSTTFILGYLLCSIVFIVLSKSKYFRFILILSSLILGFFLLISHDCKKKVSHFDYDDIIEEDIRRDGGELTTSIYERSIVLSLRTLKTKPLGWGYDGTIKATQNYFEYRNTNFLHIDTLVWQHNLRDALGNAFKLIIEFGYIALFFIYFFFTYLKKVKISEYEIFLISILIVQLFRGAGYINGGFVISFTEIFLLKYITANNHHLKKKSPNPF